MTNDSSTGGIVVPSSSAPAQDAALDRIFHDLIAGCVGLDGTLVRPRWQPTNPKMPEASADWCAFGIQSIDTAGSVSLRHIPDGEGTDQLTRHEVIELVVSFYGPNGNGNACLLRDMVSVPQNNEAIQALGLIIVGTSEITPAPALVNENWLRKFDIRLTFRRYVARTLPILNILSAPVDFKADDGSPDQSFTVGS